MTEPFAIDKRQARRAFGHAAAGYDRAAVLQREVCGRMLERLSYVKQSPSAILDAGSGTGYAARKLRARYPGAEVIELDLALPMLLRARAAAPWWQRLRARAVLRICADIERLPLVPAAVGMVWSNLTLQWVNDLRAVLAQFQRVLEPGGLLMFSTFGPDTLKELRAAYRAADPSTHVHRFVDMHDIGDLLLEAGFADPVMDMEQITLTYAGVLQLMRELKAIGAGNAAADRPRGLTGKARLAAVERDYERFRSGGRLPATFEVVYGHAWKPRPRVGPAGRAVIDIKSERS
ncbi:MAG TPA: malonyl-ACP O-methyltransferase BioC [Burkholderiales bacterium]|nr:malonyl-ACP O-methyltransferase BioC [Burkholderiales bacterium]